jgi:D-glycero-D-manno-heptose 1,7-bisphosphate phosphatase
MAVTARLDPAVFLDKDGTLVENVPYNVRPERVTLLPGVLEGLRALQERGYRLVVVSNQPGVALGYFPRRALASLEACIDRLVAAAGVVISAYAWCPHHPRGTRPAYTRTCDCRKPAPGLLLEAAALHGIDLQASWMIGDILDDVEAGARAGCRTVLVDRGGETEWLGGPYRTPEAIVSTFAAACSYVLGAPPRTRGASSTAARERGMQRSVGAP